jgi:hypothetical protein
MVNNEERFYKYLHNQLDEVERLQFENELKNSQNILSEFEDYKKIIESVNVTRDIKLSDNYIQQVIPRFRAKSERNNITLFHPVIGFAMVIVLMVGSYLLISQMLSSQTQNEFLSINDISDEDINYLIDDIDLKGENILSESQANKIDSIYNQKISENILQLVELDENDRNLYLTDLKYSELDEYLTASEIEEIYSELFNERIY